MKIIIHYAEIALKGKNRHLFEKQLINNIKSQLNPEKIEKNETRIVCTTDSIEKLKELPGISSYSIVEESEPNLDEILNTAKDLLKNSKLKEISPKTKRADKSFPLTSPEMNTKLGDLANTLDIELNYKSENKLYLEITSKKAYLYLNKAKGLGGLPVGSAGKVLCLLSGGIDSSVASFLAMKRGCRVDFLHFHTFKTNKEVLNSKIKNIVEKLNKYQGTSKLYTIPYHNYQLNTLDKIPENLDVVIFKNFILRIAQELSKKHKYKAIITGDSIGQVASQTLPNIQATRFEIENPILSPLITYDKQEIIDLSKKINLYEDSIQKYKDCCSIIARKPSTAVNIEKLKPILKNIDIKKLVDSTMKEMETFK